MSRPSLWHPRVVLPELAWMLVLVFGYSLARLFVVVPATGIRNADRLWRLERFLRLPSEAAVQHAVLASGVAVRLAGEYYAWAHFPVTAAFLLWVYVRRHETWGRIRNTLTLFTAAAFLIEAVIPMAPPRLMPGLGLVDTAARLGQSVYPASPDSGPANQYAAMPSVHFGWALVVGVGVVLVGRSSWRWLAILHPVATFAVITVTANHFWGDSVTAGVLVILAFRLTPARRTAPARTAGAPTGSTTEPARHDCGQRRADAGSRGHVHHPRGRP